ncbi:MAG TPA: DUF6468 domain-containing protein [Allosphingosinicella sp.]|jgi:hypothetical protein
MSFATLTSIVLIALCSAFLVQSVRMMKSFDQVKKGGLKETVEALDRATAQARVVLADLKDTLRTEGAANARLFAKSEEMREELTVMVGIANAVAERIIATVEAAPKAAPAAAPDIAPEPADEPAQAPAPAAEPVQEAKIELQAEPAPIVSASARVPAKPKAPRTRTRPPSRAERARAKVAAAPMAAAH